MNHEDLQKIQLRPVTMQDAESIFAWRNSPITRKYFFNPTEITKEDHFRWLHESIDREDRIILIGEITNEPIGVLRFDLYKTIAEIDIYLVPGLYGKGLGTSLLSAGTEWLSLNLPQIKEVNAKVLDENIISKKAFAKAGFREFYTVYTYPIQK